MKTEKLKFYDIFYIFLFGCVFGWIVEGIWTYVKKGLIINHSALVLGPFNLIYGLGAVVLTLMLYKIKKSNIIKIFISSFIAGSLLEYIISFLMEHLVGFVAWNYSSKFMNINGRICLVYSIFWGILGIIWIKLIYPIVQKIINKIKPSVGKLFIKIMSVFLILNAMLTMMAIYRAEAEVKGIAPTNAVERMLDEYFGYDYLNNMFNYRWKLK